MGEHDLTYVKGLAALIYYENPKKTVKTKDRPAMSISFEKLSLEEQERYCVIAGNINNYINKLNMVVVKKGIEISPGEKHSLREQKYENILSIMKSWGKELKVIKKVEKIIPWEELAKRVRNELEDD